MERDNLQTSAGFGITWSATLLLVASFLIAFPTMFATFAHYDDEGYVMMTLRTYMDGHRLYGDTHTQYGPAYYLLTAPLHSVFGLPLNHDAVRLKSVVIWLLVVILCSLVIYRLSRSTVCSTFIGLLVAIQLRKLSLEPGHPQELALIASIATLLCVTFFSHVSSGVLNLVAAPVLAGLFATIVGCTKLNCGVVASIPLITCAALCVVGNSTSRMAWTIARGIQVTVFAAVLTSGVAIAWSSRSDFFGSLWALSGTLAAITFICKFFPCFVIDGTPATDDSDNLTNLPMNAKGFLPLMAVSGSVLLTSLTIAIVVISSGGRLSELWYGIVRQHQNFSDHFFQPIRPFASSVIETCLVAMLLAILVYYSRTLLPGDRLRRWTIVSACGIFGFYITVNLFKPLSHGLEPLVTGHLLAVFGPWMIVYLYSMNNTDRSMASDSVLRRFGVGLFGILSPWIAFPVAGTQVELGTIPTLLAIGIGIWDWTPRDAFKEGQFVRVDLALVRRYGCLGTVVALVYGISLLWMNYQSGTPLGLSGASLLRLPLDVVNEEKKLVSEMMHVAASFRPRLKHLVFEGHNNNRFYFWTGLEPLTAINPTFFPRMITDSQEDKLIQAMNQSSGICVVRVPNYERLTGDGIPRFTSWIQGRYHPVLQMRGTEISDWQIGYIDGKSTETLQLLKLAKTCPTQDPQNNAGNQHDDVHQWTDHFERSQSHGTKQPKPQIHKEEKSN